MEVELAGETTFRAGGAPAEQWKLTLGGTTVSYTVGYGATLADVARGLRDVITTTFGNAYTVTLLGRKLTITRLDGTDFTAAGAITPDSVGAFTITPQLIFTPTNWMDAQTVTVIAIDDDFIDGSDALVFPGLEERVNDIRGPVIIDGAIRANEDRFLKDPFRLPGETNFPVADGAIESRRPERRLRQLHRSANHARQRRRRATADGFDPRVNDFPYSVTFLTGVASPGRRSTSRSAIRADPFSLILTTPWPNGVQPSAGDKYFYTPVNLNERVDEADQVDTLNVFNGHSPANDVGTLTGTTITGLGMGGRTVIGGRVFERRHRVSQSRSGEHRTRLG